MRVMRLRLEFIVGTKRVILIDFFWRELYYNKIFLVSDQSKKSEFTVKISIWICK